MLTWKLLSLHFNDIYYMRASTVPGLSQNYKCIFILHAFLLEKFLTEYE